MACVLQNQTSSCIHEQKPKKRTRQKIGAVQTSCPGEVLSTFPARLQFQRIFNQPKAND